MPDCDAATISDRLSPRRGAQLPGNFYALKLYQIAVAQCYVSYSLWTVTF